MRKLFIVLLAACLLTGCAAADDRKEEAGEASASQRTEYTVRETAAKEHTDREEMQQPELLYYAYTTLETAEEQQLYREILSVLQNREEETELSTLKKELLEPVFQCVMEDHPEIFYVDGYTSTLYRLGNTLKKITFSGTYTMDGQEIRQRRQQLAEASRTWLAGLDDKKDDYEKAKYLYESLIHHTEYEMGAADSQNICSVLLNGRSVCQGYAKTLQYLCQRAGIPALLVTGKVNGQGHAWDLLMLDGAWYYVDPTWGDASYQQEEAGDGMQAYPAINYDYFGVTTRQIKMTHEITDASKLPDCTAVAANYYRREGLYLESADTGRIADIFREAVQQGRESVTFQCADEEVYQELYRILIEEQQVFSYLPASAKTAAYADSPKLRTFSFWL